MDHIFQKRARILIQVSIIGTLGFQAGVRSESMVGTQATGGSNSNLDNDRTVRRTDGTIIQNTISESFSSMVVTENSTNNVNQSFTDFINDQKYVWR